MHLRMVIKGCGFALAALLWCGTASAGFGVSVSGKAKIIDPPDSAKWNKLESSKFQVWYEGTTKLAEDICLDHVVDPDLQCKPNDPRTSKKNSKSSKNAKNSKNSRKSQSSRNQRDPDYCLSRSRSCYNYYDECRPQCGKIEEGTCVSTYLIHLDPNERLTYPTACFTFDKEILGLAFKSTTLDETDWLGAPGTCYPTGNSFRGIDFLDFFKITNGGYTLQLSFLAKYGFDQIRVFTAGCCSDPCNPPCGVPEPASIVVWSLALVGGGFAGRRRMNRVIG